MKRILYLTLIIISILIVDQSLKIWIKNNMYLGQEYKIIGNWFIIHFIENNGMAFGMEFAGEYGKLFLSSFRIVAVFAIGYFIIKLDKMNYPFGFLVSVSLILAGALGNIIDSVFYGKIYGYAPLLHGRVVDMFYFPIIDTTFPDWFPFWGGEDFIFFRPVFNIADISISIGVMIIVLFQRKYLDFENHTQN